ncbi:M23 family metallopeptidase [Cohnella sp. REN36]|uniref:M23 family metallopeptidase n=1 Tax=Cohnella sp. REN36 TaxID=2887347 RepID=UPI001D140B0C|nr:M23 family metallopeptidase [Cohnella sp. REN36]MCC3374126.1 M23 family metallopeptidase [Cohnella sp. REN36]
MNDQNNKTRKIEEASKSVVGSSARPSAWKRFFAKRWVFPALYMAAAAIIVTVLWLNASSGDKTKSQEVAGSGIENGVAAEGDSASPDAVPAAANGETLRWPVTNREALTVSLPFYDVNGTDDQKAAAMVQYDNQFTPHTAIDLASKDGKAFDVKAAMSGEVVVAEQTPVNGYEVQIKHPNGLTTVYQSLAELKVKKGDEVKQGDLIGAAGQSEMEKSEGVHVHFEVLSNGQSVDPSSLIKDKE